MKIVICTLRRSGSTVFWKTFRENTNFTCYDEPFNPGLSVLPQEHKKKVYAEYINLIDKNATLFWEKFDAISPIEENKNTLTHSQKDYLKYLLESAEDVVIDTTRCWNKLASLKEILEPYPHVFIHLYRDPIAFTSSHLLPSEIKSWRFNRKLKKDFWTKKDGFNYWKMEEVMGNRVNTCFDQLILKESTKISGNNFYKMPAYKKLHLYWSLVYRKVKNDGENLFGKDYNEIKFETFCKSPNITLEKLKSKYNIMFVSNHINVYEPNLGFDRLNSKWNDLKIP